MGRERRGGELIERARARLDLSADQYTYETSGTDGTTVLIPAWATGNPGGVRPQTSRPAMKKRVRGDSPTGEMCAGTSPTRSAAAAAREHCGVRLPGSRAAGKSIAELAPMRELGGW